MVSQKSGLPRFLRAPGPLASGCPQHRPEAPISQVTSINLNHLGRGDSSKEINCSLLPPGSGRGDERKKPEDVAAISVPGVHPGVRLVAVWLWEELGPEELRVTHWVTKTVFP